ncbi:hypothetical protein [Cerasicoccus arenae]|uniref:Uncharacterized protein n=1 Tax=Cerasicoccus arenae TaxID=424488 RepID=A0A8J3GF02_9BACT|nr:hypothetical protein [Cerasicoccus arenae]MBK1859291.1 hypothetical protein [Cerasicoccus arenae]GHC13359.1 hypothetical protein GCM10007047_33380 [Cerasicoccus arenae]
MSAPSAKGNLVGSIFLGLFGSFFFVIGVGAAIATYQQGHSGDGQSVWVGVIMGTFFALVGAGIIYAAFASHKKGKKAVKLAAEHPNAPWLHRRDWAEGRIVDSNKVGFIFVLIFAVFWNAIAWAATIGVFKEGSNADEAARYVVLLFPLVGLGLAYAAIYQLMRWRKFGSSAFDMAEVPGVIGGSLGGIILTKVNVRPEKGFHLSLRNIKEVVTGSGKNRSTNVTVLWESEQWVKEDALADDPTQSAIPVLFNIPFSCSSPENVSSSVTIKWELKVKAEMPGVDYQSTFEVPVFKTENSDPDFDARAARDAETVASAPVVDWRKSGIVIRDDFSGATLVEARAGRNFIFLFVPLLIGLGMLVGTYFAWNSNMPKIFPIFLTIFGLLVTAGCGGALFTSLRLKIFPDRLESERRFFGLTKYASVNVSELDRLESISTMSSGEVHFYDLVGIKHNGEKVKFPLRIRGKAQADAMIKLIEDKISTDR